MKNVNLEYETSQINLEYKCLTNGMIEQGSVIHSPHTQV